MGDSVDRVDNLKIMRLKYDLRSIRFCLICNAEFRPQDNKGEHHGLCYRHRLLFWRSWYATYGKYVDWTKYKETRDRAWDRWVERNKERRRAQALASYHRKKNDPVNKKRKHRKTIK